jgi:hydroxyacylglutathione hydrolase
VDRLLRETERRDLRVTKALITHWHNDHVEGVGALVAATGARVVVGRREEPRVRHGVGAALGDAPELVDDGTDVAIGRRGVRALLAPGHTAGGICYLADGWVVTGDVLFVGGCGRTDFPGGDAAELWRTLQRLSALPEETRVYPGHNYGATETSTIGRELVENRFLRCADLAAFRALREGRPKA